ncbi:MAG: gamma-glutamyltransferase [Firmicutes bacterium]|nr:gamma-glutamyltransferase [Bacillota bacterium]
MSFFHWQRAKPQMARNYMIAAEHPLAVQGGLAVLEAGGNAMDAAVAAAAISWVVMPDMCGPGGDLFIIGYQDGKLWALNGCGEAPGKAEANFFASLGLRQMPLDGLLSASVPGAVAGLVAAHARYGSLPWEKLLEKAIFFAERGFPVSHRLYNSIINQRAKLEKFPEAAALFLPGGRPLRPGEILRQPDLAATLRTLARDGSDPFYRGRIAEKLLALSAKEEGLFTGEELAAHASEFYEPISITYRGYRIYQNRPPSQGVIMLEALGILDNFPLSSLGFDDPDKLHLVAESLKIAFRDRNGLLGDPRFVDVPLGRLLAAQYVQSLAEAIDLNRASFYSGPHAAGDTTSFVIVDGEGRGVSFIHSNSIPFGSGMIIPGTGILLNNRAGRSFTLAEGHPNCIAPGKRPMHTLNTYIVTKEDKLWLLGNTPGGDGQVQWNLQVLSCLIDHNYNPRQAAGAPRCQVFPGTDPADLKKPPVLFLEEGFSRETGDSLMRRGHQVRWTAQGGGAVQLIQVEDGLLLGGSDPRSEGLVLGL